MLLPRHSKLLRYCKSRTSHLHLLVTKLFPPVSVLTDLSRTVSQGNSHILPPQFFLPTAMKKSSISMLRNDGDVLLAQKRKSIVRDKVDSLVPKECRTNLAIDVSSGTTNDTLSRRTRNDDDDPAEFLRDIPADLEEGEVDDNEDDDEEEEAARSGGKVCHGCHLVRGKMDHEMEDYVVAENRKVDGYELGLYAIFDGHSGRNVAKYLQAHLFDNILNEPDFWRNPKSAIRRAYRTTDQEILEHVVGRSGGSTAVTAILIDGKTLVVANVGDSRAVLCRNGMATQVSVDHEPEKERGLVESKGGFVVEMPGNVPRVDGQLAMSRAFGDARLKDHISSEPDLKIVTIDRDDTDFIILASDGLWKVMSNQDACDCIRGVEDPKEAAKTLIAEALARGSKDDISCIVVMID